MSAAKIKKLTAKEERFCRRYLIDCNATKSAQEIGYSKRTAREIGYRLLTKVHVQKRIKQLRDEMEGHFDITKENMLHFLYVLRDFDIRNIYDKQGNLKPIHTLDDETAAALSSIDTDEITEYINGNKVNVGITRKVKSHSKIEAAKEINRMMGYTSSVKISGTGTDDKGNTIKEFKVTLNL